MVEMLTPLAVCCTSAQISSGVACSSLVTASSTSWRWGVTRYPRARSSLSHACVMPPRLGHARVLGGTLTAPYRRRGRPPPSQRADNSLALAGRSGITCGQRGKGGGPTACIAVGLARWLSASRRPAGAPAVASATRCDHWPSLAHLLVWPACRKAAAGEYTADTEPPG